MPPKQVHRTPSGAAIGLLPTGTRRNISIASFFDAATSQPRRHGGVDSREGQGYHHSGSLATGTLTSSTSLTSSIGHGSHLHTTDARVTVNSRQRSSLTDGGEGGEYSTTLQEVRHRILAEVEEEASNAKPAQQSRGGAGPSRLRQHRQRALEIAFGAGEGGAQCSTNSPTKGRGSGGASQRGAEDGVDEEELMVSSVEFSLLCPYSRLPMAHPVRSKDCRHVQCCDLDSWMVLLDKCRSLRDPKGPCPVCEQRVAASSLEVDFWMMNVISQMPPGTRMVVLDADGSYRNGDLTRERRKEMLTTEVIDATQGADVEDYLGDIIDDDSDVDAVCDGGNRSLPPAPTKRQRSPSPGVEAVVTRAHDRHSPQPTGTALPSVKKERLAATAAAEAIEGEAADVSTAASAQAPPASAPSESASCASEDHGVVLVHYVEGRARRALPSQVRLWVPHCPRCGTTFLKGEDGVMESACRGCGHTTQDEWTLVRRFEERNSVTMELTADDTLLLRGVDAASAFLFRAGFHRTLFGAKSTGGPQDSGVWTTSSALTRVELDFLEACCERIARGEDVGELRTTMMVPSLFRVPGRRKPATAGGSTWSRNGAGEGGYRSTTVSQQYFQTQSHGPGGVGGGSPAGYSQSSQPSPFSMRV